MAASAALARSADAVVVGAGVIGCSVALNLARQGRKVIVVDALRGAAQGSTSYSSGICRPFYSVLNSVKFAYEGFHYWRNWQDYVRVRDERGIPRLRQCGGLILRSADSAPFIDKVLPLFDEVGIAYEELDRLALEKRFGEATRYGMDLTCYGPPKRIDHDDFGTPAAGPGIQGAVFVPETGYISDPQLGTLNMQLAAEETGRANFMFDRKVVKIPKDSAGMRVTGVVLDDGTRVDSPVVVNVTGPYSSLLNLIAFEGSAVSNDMRITTRPLRQEVAYLPASGYAGDSDGSDSGPVLMDNDTGVYMRPEVGDKLLIGSLEPECDELHFLDTPDEADSALTDDHTNFTYRAALRMPRLPLTTAGGAQGIAACYDVTEDWTPIYDRSALQGYYMAIGTSGNQFKNAGPAGVMMAELIERVESGHDHDAAPIQFPLEWSGKGTVDMSAFSRLRDIMATSGSVLG